MDRSAFDVPGQWLKGNLHLHTTVSDGAFTPQECVDAYRERGYDFLAITDHHHTADLEGLDGGSMTLLPGIETDFPGGELGQEFHLVGVGVRQQFERPASGQGQDFIDALNDIAELCWIGHPWWSSLRSSEIMPLEGVIGMEVFNTTCRRGIGRGTSEVQWDECLARGKRLFGLAVDDSHGHLDDRFGGWVMVRAEEPTPEALYSALRAGHFYASCGPTIKHVEISDENVHVECSPCVEAFVVCPFSGKGWTNWRTGGGRDPVGEMDLLLRPGTDPIRIVVVDETGARAWTNPFWQD